MEGCKLQLLPILFPDDFEFDRMEPSIIGKNGTCILDEEFWNILGITKEFSRILFVPCTEENKKILVINGVLFEQLNLDASETQVNEQIKKFINAIENGNKPKN